MVGTAFKQTCFPWALFSFRSLLELLFAVASGLLEGDSPLTCSYWKLWCLQLQVSRNLQITSSLIILILHSPEQLLQRSTDSTVPETMCALSYVSSYSGKKKLLTPSVARWKFWNCLFHAIEPMMSFSFHYAENKAKGSSTRSPSALLRWDGRVIVLGKGDWITAAFDFQVFLVPSWWLNMCRTLWHSGENGFSFLWN